MTLWCNELLSFHVGFSAVAIILMRLNSWLSTLYCPVFSFSHFKITKDETFKTRPGLFCTHSVLSSYHARDGDVLKRRRGWLAASVRLFPTDVSSLTVWTVDVSRCCATSVCVHHAAWVLLIPTSTNLFYFYRLREPILQSLRTVAEGLIGYNSPNRPKPELIWTKLGI